MRVTHAFTSAKSDGGDATLVRPSNWNADHVILGDPTGFVGASAYSVATQSLTSTVNAVLTLDTEYFDTDAFHSTSSNTSRMTIPAGLGGKYLLTGTAGFAANATGVRVLGFYKNGAAINAGVNIHTPTAAAYIAPTTSAVLDLVAGDYVELYGQQDSGGALSTVANVATFSIVKLDSGKVGSAVGARGVWTTNQAVANVTYVKYDWTGTDEFDTDLFHNPASNPNRFTIPTGLGGKYLVTVNAAFDSNATGYRGVVINKNLEGSGSGDQIWQQAPNGIQAWMTLSRVIDLAAGDYVAASVYQSSGGSLNLVGGAMSIMRLDSQGSSVLPAPAQTYGPASDVSTTADVLLSSFSVAATAPQSGRIAHRGCLVVRMGAVTADTLLRSSKDGGTTKNLCGAAGWDGAALRRNIPFEYIWTDLTPGTAYTFTIYWEPSGGNTSYFDGASRGAVQYGSYAFAVPL